MAMKILFPNSIRPDKSKILVIRLRLLNKVLIKKRLNSVILFKVIFYQHQEKFHYNLTKLSLNLPLLIIVQLGNKRKIVLF